MNEKYTLYQKYTLTIKSLLSDTSLSMTSSPQARVAGGGDAGVACDGGLWGHYNTNTDIYSANRDTNTNSNTNKNSNTKTSIDTNTIQSQGSCRGDAGVAWDGGHGGLWGHGGPNRKDAGRKRQGSTNILTTIL